MSEDILGTGRCRLVTECQSCGGRALAPAAFLGFLPPVNTMAPVGSRPREQGAFPAELLRCGGCGLVQLGLVVDPAVLFPPDYAYTSGTTRILRDNFKQLSEEVPVVTGLAPGDLVVDVGANDGTLLSNFAGRYRVLGIEPTGAGELARQKGIEVLTEFFSLEAGRRVAKSHGAARLVTATNVFAHIPDPNGVVEGVLAMLAPDGFFVTESHYLASLVETVQFDTVYHEHLRYYSLDALRVLLGRHGLEVVHARRIPTHGGSVRVYAARRGTTPARPSVAALLEEERRWTSSEALEGFRRRSSLAKLGLQALLLDIKRRGGRVFGVGAPSRAATLVNFVGLDDATLDCIVEIKGSRKIGRYMPGTRIPVVDEEALFREQPGHALLLSWHLADELAPKLRARGFRGEFIVPLPEPRVLPTA